MLTKEIYDQRIASHEEAIEKNKRSKANFQEYMGNHASLWDEQKWLEAKRFRATVFPHERN